MVVKRIAVLGMVLLTGACARFPSVPTAYSALPPAPIVSGPEEFSATPPVPALPSMTAEPGVAPPAVIIPGTLTMPVGNGGARAVNPTAVLETSMRTRMAWETLRPADLLKPPTVPTRSLARATDDDAAETALGTPTLHTPPVAARPYDREAMMSRLLKISAQSAHTICSGC